MSTREKHDTHQKALALNLDTTIFGSFAEIGAGKEVARWFLRVGGASVTLAKTTLRLRLGSERPPLSIRDTLRLQTAPSVHARPRVGSTAETIACQLRSHHQVFLVCGYRFCPESCRDEWVFDQSVCWV